MLPLWRQIHRQNFTRLDVLADFLELTPDQRGSILPRAHFPLNLPIRLAKKIAKGTLDDPILRQFVPHPDELIPHSDFISDPTNDLKFRRSSRLLSKYHGRVLLIASQACAMHCRFCFRQNFPYDAKPDFSEEWKAIARDPTIQEVILSGGDPLSLSNESLEDIFNAVGQIPHIRRLRFHTRFPIGIPERIDEGFLLLLSRLPLQTIFVFHINHPRELDDEVLAALHQIRAPLLCQSALLKGVNDDEETLFSLCQALVNGGILPYYLHLLDRVAGSSRFEVSPERGCELIAYLQKHMPGYGVPRLVREIPGKPNKVFLK